MPFSDTSAKKGILQRIEQLTGLGDGGITNNATLLKVMTAVVNDAFDEIMPLLLSYSDRIRFDDINHSDLPIGTVNIVSGQADYSVTVDDNSLDILNITDVRIKQSSSATDFATLDRLYQGDELALEAMSPNPSVSGVPTHWLESNNVIFLYPEPNYSSTNGLKLFFEREQSYFVSTDTTKEPGIPKLFHGLLPIIASHEWLFVNKPSNTAVITRLETKITQRKKELFDLISARNPTKSRIIASVEDNK